MQRQYNRVTPTAFQRMNDLGIFVTSHVKRGTQGFGRLTIPVRLSRGYTCEPTKRETTVQPQAGGLGDWWSRTKEHGCNVNNLITVSCQQEKHVTCILLNAQSLCNKTLTVREHMLDYKAYIYDASD